MSTSGKIRLLLALLSVSFLFTAIIVENIYAPVHNLYQTAKTLEKNLHKKESYVNEVLNTNTGFNKLKSLANNERDAISFINDFTTNNRIWVLTYNKGNLIFWSGIKFIPNKVTDIKEGYSFIKRPNGYYEAIKKTKGDFTAIFFIPVKVDYAFQNQYLQNTFDRGITGDNNIEIADFTDKQVYEVHSINRSYLFSVKEKKGEVSQQFLSLSYIFWILGILTLCIFIHTICNYFVYKGHLLLSITGLALFILLVRFINLYFGWPYLLFQNDMFNPKYYASGYIYPSFGDFCINIFCISWFVSFVFHHRSRLLKKVPGKITSYFILIACILSVLIITTGFLNLFRGLVLNSKINFEVNNILDLSVYSIIGVLMLCFTFLTVYLFNEIILTIANKLPIPDTHRSFLFITGVILATIITSYYQGFTIFYILIAISVFIRGYGYRYNQGKINSSSLVVIIAVYAITSTILLNQFESIKETNTRKAFIHKLEVPDDITADLLFKKIEKQIITDPLIIQYFNDSLYNGYLKNRFQKLYFDGYLSKYMFNIYQFNEKGKPLTSDKNYSLDVFKDLVLYSSFKVSDYFYRENDSFGFQNYFAIIPIAKEGKALGTIVIELKAKPLQYSGSFPELLIDGQIRQEDEYKDYSYAFYFDNKLLSQSGNYIYDLTNKVFKGQLKKYNFLTTKNNDAQWYNYFTTYNHLIYKPGKRNLIVVSKPENVFFAELTSLTFFFVILLAFSVIVITLRWLWLRIKILYIEDKYIKWSFKIKFDRILYKTRIRFSMIFAVVITLILVGVITYISISTQYNEQQEKMIRDKINRITAAFENGQLNKYIYNASEATQVQFDEFANTYSTDLILFNTDGVPLITTQPKIYEYGLLARRMNARAYIYLAKLQKSEFINEETVGKLKYKAVYAPLRNSKNQTIAYLQLPYFANEADYKERMGSLLNVMINVYALIFIAIGLFAIVIARQITAPLNFIQDSLSKIVYGKKNEPIIWERDDEIGALVKEYNKMIEALEYSAQRLAQSERESAWREMAKQVAHEIKNPLTPLKLGLQLLDKSWKDKDPKFDQKFERFSKSFVEQIESLSSIASEFSAFAKMPDTRIEQINIFEMLNQAVTIFNQMDNMKIIYQPPEKPFYIGADRDQILRCFNNLLKNAIEATPPERDGIIEINYLVTSKNILLSIKDNGNGIAENLRDKIFEPNFTTKSSGTGLGLAFVKNSIENAGGKVWFETIIDVGTTFYFSLPVAM